MRIRRKYGDDDEDAHASDLTIPTKKTTRYTMNYSRVDNYYPIYTYNIPREYTK